MLNNPYIISDTIDVYGATFSPRVKISDRYLSEQ